MSPRHVLPLRPVGVPLVVEVPHTVLVEHAVGVVHPSVQRRVVEGGPVFLAVGGVERVRQLHVLPAGVLLGLAQGGAVLRRHDVEHHVAALERGKVQRHEIVHAVACQADVEVLVNLSVEHNPYPRFFGVFLYGKQQVPAGAGHSHEGVVYPQVVDFNAILGRSRGGVRHRAEEKQRRDNVFYRFHICQGVLMLFVFQDSRRPGPGYESSGAEVPPMPVTGKWLRPGQQSRAHSPRTS